MDQLIQSDLLQRVFNVSNYNKLMSSNKYIQQVKSRSEEGKKWVTRYKTILQTLAMLFRLCASSMLDAFLLLL